MVMMTMVMMVMMRHIVHDYDAVADIQINMMIIPSVTVTNINMMIFPNPKQFTARVKSDAPSAHPLDRVLVRL
jgi:hypothetical protein